MAVFLSLLSPSDPTPFSENRTLTLSLDYNLIAKHHVPLIQKCEVLRDSLPAGVTDHMPIHLHLALPTSPTPPLKPSSQSSPPRTL